MNIEPVNKQIILIVPQVKDDYSSGIIIPASTQEKPHQGIVFKSDDPQFVPGEILLYRKYSGFEFTHESVDYLVIEPGDVLVKMQESEEDKRKREEKEKAYEEFQKNKPSNIITNKMGVH